jgi:hypothetical protein
VRSSAARASQAVGSDQERRNAQEEENWRALSPTLVEHTIGTTGKQREMLTECVEAGRAITQKAIDDVPAVCPKCNMADCGSVGGAHVLVVGLNGSYDVNVPVYECSR